MDMDSVIGAQRVERRRAAPQAGRDAGNRIISPLDPAKLGLGAAEVARRRPERRPGAPSPSRVDARLFYDFSPRKAPEAAPRVSAAPPPVSPRAESSTEATLADAFKPFEPIDAAPRPALKSKAAFSVPSGRRLAFGLGAALVAFAAMAGAALLAAMPPRPDLSAVTMPSDDSAIALILESLGPEPAANEEPAALAELPLRLSVGSHRVARNETLDQIARRYGVRIETLISINGITNVRRLQAGATLKIPNLDGVAYVVRRGDSLASIAAAHRLSVLDIIDANDLASQTLSPGQALFLPGARMSSTELKKALGTLIEWPVRGRISSNFGYRANPFTGVRQFHNGLDIVAPEDTPVKAAMDGRVAETGYSAVFGNFVILTHAGSYQTLYAHLSAIRVRQGQTLSQGAVVGLLGSTGYSTGPHLHFGLFLGGKAIDPLSMLGR